MPFPFGPIVPVSGSSLILLDQGFESAALGNLGTLSSFGSGMLSLTRASSATVQTGTSTIDSTATTDQARVGSLGLGWQGLVLEESHINRLADSRDITTAAWTAGTGSSTTGYSATAPDGAATVNRYNCTSAQYGRFSPYNGGANAYNESMWARSTTGTNSSQGLMNNVAFGGALTTSWVRQEIGGVTNGNDFFCYCLAAGGGTAAARDYLVDFLSIQGDPTHPTSWSSEAIVTSGGAATRAADVLKIPSGLNVVSSGQISLYLQVYPKAASTGYNTTVAQYLFYLDANNYARIEPSTHKVSVTIASTTLTSASAISFSKYDNLEIFIQAGGGANCYVSYRVNGGATTVLLNAALAGSYSSAGAVTVLGGAGNFSCWLSHLTAYSFSNKPVWA